MRVRLAVVLLPLLILLPLQGQAPAPSDAGIEFFEKKIRPVLVESCYGCHSVAAGKKRGELLLDSRPAMLEGGESGPAVVPGKPNESLLIKAIRYTEKDLRMPQKGKLPAAVIADFEKWVAMGAPDPRQTAVVKGSKYGPSVEDGRKFWAFQPVKNPALPAIKDKTWPHSSVDHFVLAGLEGKGLKPAAAADRTVLLRRTYFALIGLPPSPQRRSTLSSWTNRRRHSRKWSIACWRNRSLAIAGAAFGSTWRATPNRLAAAVPCCSRTPGATAITSSGRSTPASRSTTSCSNRLPAICCRPKIPRNATGKPWRPPICCLGRTITRARTSRSWKWTSSTRCWTRWDARSSALLSAARAATITSSTRFPPRITTLWPASSKAQNSSSTATSRNGPSSRCH